MVAEPFLQPLSLVYFEPLLFGFYLSSESFELTFSKPIVQVPFPSMPGWDSQISILLVGFLSLVRIKFTLTVP